MSTVIFDKKFDRKTDDYNIDDPTVRCRVEFFTKRVGNYDNCEHYTVKITDENGRSLVRAKTFKGECAWSDSKRYASDSLGDHTYGMAFMAVDW